MAHHDAIVIGTGFGGAVSACRLAQAGIAVKVLERGKRYDQLPVPAFPRGPVDEWLWQKKRGLFEIWPIAQMRALQAAGYGGGSLIYANVHLRLPPEVFGRRWPEGYSREALDPYYDLVAHMLDIKPITESPQGLPPKAQRMTDAVVRLRRKDQLFHPPLAIRFSTDPALRPNKFGVMQGGCTYVGECVIGCPQRAKNTLDMNYLAVAERLGAEMHTECEVSRIERVDEAGVPRYRVTYRDHRRGGQELVDEAAHVFLCAGALNSTALLLRSREAGALPRLSRRLGEGYSGNGDMLALGFDIAEPFEPDRGPTITSGLVYAGKGKDGEGWFLIEDGGFSRHLWPLFALARPHVGWISRPEAFGSREPPTAATVDEAFRRASAQMSSALADPEAMRRTAVFLAMGRDLANGRLRLLPGGGVAIQWDVPSNLMTYSLEERIVQDIVAQLEGTFAISPFWRFAHLPISVHHLGGCGMGKSEDEGVTSEIGEVFNYENLFVLDGAILPSATGVNPSHTIAAVAERNIERIIRRITGARDWTPPERASVEPYSDPLSRVVIPPEGTPLPEHPGLGLSFHERMDGAWERAGEGPSGSSPPEPVRLRLRITVGYLARFLSDPAHPALIDGTVFVGGLSAKDAEISEGVWNLFAGTGPEREMRYVVPFYGDDGRRYTLHGVKVFRPRPGLGLWRENTTLDVRIIEGTMERGRVVGRGVARIGFFGVLRLLSSLRVPGRHRLLDRLRAIAGFLEFYLRTLARVSRGQA